MPYIEDYLKEFYTGSIRVSSFDSQIASSLGLQTLSGKPLTSKQGAVSLKLLKKYSNQFLSKGFISINDDIESPTFKHPFRIVENKRTVELVDNKIVIKFPFDQSVVNSMREVSNEYIFCKPVFDPGTRSWCMDLNEESLMIIIDKFGEFEWDDEIKNFVNQIVEVRTNIENHIPILTKRNNEYYIKNSIFKNSYNDLTTAAIESIKKGIYVYDETVNQELVELSESIPIIKIFTSKTSQKYLINNTDFSKKDLLWFLNQFDLTVAFFVNDDFNSDELELWMNEMYSVGILNNQIAVYYRKSSELDKEFNQKIKDLKLNKDAEDSNVKWMFLSSKYPKSLVRHNKIADICLFVDKQVTTHYTVINVANNALLNIIYSDKKFAILEDSYNKKRGEKIVVL